MSVLNLAAVVAHGAAAMPVAAAIGTIVLALCMPLSALARLRRPQRCRRTQCVECGRPTDRGGPPLLYFRGIGLRCTDCVRGTEPRPQHAAPESTSPTTAGPTNTNTVAAARADDHVTREVFSHAAA